MSRYILCLLLPAALSLSVPRTLIVQNKGGGHGEIGYHLAKSLTDKGHDVTLLQDAAHKQVTPYTLYDSLKCKVVTCAFDDSFALPESGYDYVFDNNSKDPAKPVEAKLLEAFSKDKPKRYCYVSSAGLYKPVNHGGDTDGPLTEDMPVASKGQAHFETALTDKGIPMYSFRPQYIYGPVGNKYSYVDYYLDRITRGLPVPIPGSGKQKVSLTDARDVAGLLAAAVTCEGPPESPQVFNCGTPNLYTYDEVAEICARATGKEAVLLHFDPDTPGLKEGPGKGGFPFRENNFHVVPDKAVGMLGWDGGSHSLEGDIGEYFEAYKGRANDDKFNEELKVDKEIFGIVKAVAA